MKERNRGVNKERVTRDGKPNDPIGKLVKATPSKDVKEVPPLVEEDLEENRDHPEKQSC